MFARISFDDRIKLIKDEVKELEAMLGEEVDCEELVKDKDGNITEYYSWAHVFDENEVDDKKKLVYKTDIVKLNTSKEYLAEVETFIQRFPQIKIKIRGMIQTSGSMLSNMISQFQDIERKFATALSSFNEGVEFNQKCNVHIGNLGLLNINQLGFAVDKCTEELQDILNQGWRILAVCPQPDQRRPDYVLGRFNGDDTQTKVDCIRF